MLAFPNTPTIKEDTFKPTIAWTMASDKGSMKYTPTWVNIALFIIFWSTPISFNNLYLSTLSVDSVSCWIASTTADVIINIKPRYIPK